MNKIKELVRFFYYINFLNEGKVGASNAKMLSVFASPRGGSTWLAQTLNQLPNSALVWEPLFKYNSYKINTFNPFAYPERHEVDISWNQYIPKDAKWNEAELFFKKLFDRVIVNLKLYRFNDLSQLAISDTFIFKFCFGNNLLPWLVERFEINPILLLRHPCAIIASQLHFAAFNWHKTNYKYDYNMRMFADEFYAPYKDVLNTITCVEERLAAEWAMNVLTPIKSEWNDKKWVTLSYEHLIKDPNSAFQKIFNRYNIEEPEGLYEQLNKTSFTKSSFEGKGNDERLNSWKNQLTDKQIDIILSFVNRLGVYFYTDDLEPDYNKIYHEI